MGRLNITQVRSRIGATAAQCKNLDALGLRKIGKRVSHEDSATILGMIERVKHLVRVEVVEAPKVVETAEPVAEKPVKEVKPKAAKAVEVSETPEAPEAPAKPKAPAKPRAPKKPKEE